MGRSALRSVAAGMLAMATGSMALAQDARAEISDEQVKIIMDYAWAMVPPKFTDPGGGVIITDKKKRPENTVPIDVSRYVIRVAMLTSKAQICELPDDQVAAYRTMMKREKAKGKWTDQQLLFINMVHLFSASYFTGDREIFVNEKDGQREVLLGDKTKAKKPTCTEAEKKKVAEAIKNFVKEEPATTAADPKKK